MYVYPGGFRKPVFFEMGGGPSASLPCAANVQASPTGPENVNAVRRGIDICVPSIEGPLFLLYTPSLSAGIAPLVRVCHSTAQMLVGIAAREGLAGNELQPSDRQFPLLPGEPGACPAPVLTDEAAEICGVLPPQLVQLFFKFTDPAQRLRPIFESHS